MKRAWVEDAQVLDDLVALSDVQDTILFRTRAVAEFLGKHDQYSAALVAPKGFGKTFVLKLKRVALDAKGYTCLPKGLIVDRPPMNPPTAAHDLLDLLADSGAWVKLWQAALAMSLLKHLAASEGDPVINDLIEQSESQALKKILLNRDLDRPFEILHEMLGLDRKFLLEIIDQELGAIIAKFARRHAKAAIFLDNIDEYVDNYLKEHKSRHANSLALWHNAQIGALLAIRLLQGVNPHVKIFISMRKEAYHFAHTKEQVAANLEAFTIHLEYKNKELASIIENNIKNEEPARLIDPTSSDIIARFFPSNAGYIANKGTGGPESILDYWLRHAVGRPRDIVILGRAISLIDPRDRLAESVREAINDKAVDVIKFVFDESSIHLREFDPDLLPKVIHTNVLSKDELADAARHYRDLYSASGDLIRESSPDIFCSLFALGLIGVVEDDRSSPGDYRQRFAYLGQYPLGASGILPEAENYVIHPALCDFIIAQDRTFLRRLSSQNVVGQGLRWHHPNEYKFVICADLEGYRKSVMSKAGESQTFQEYCDKIFASATRGLQYARWANGDSFMLADDRPSELIRSCEALARLLKKPPHHFPVRMGGHSGPWRIESLPSGNQRNAAEVVGVAARLEPKARSGSLWVTEQFIKGVLELGGEDLADRFAPVSLDEADPSTPVVISKPSEDPESFNIFELKLTS